MCQTPIDVPAHTAVQSTCSTLATTQKVYIRPLTLRAGAVPDELQQKLSAVEQTFSPTIMMIDYSAATEPSLGDALGDAAAPMVARPELVDMPELEEPVAGPVAVPMRLTAEAAAPAGAAANRLQGQVAATTPAFTFYTDAHASAVLPPPVVRRATAPTIAPTTALAPLGNGATGPPAKRRKPAPGALEGMGSAQRRAAQREEGGGEAHPLRRTQGRCL